MMIKALAFDLDGVLIDSMKYHIIAWKHAFERFDIVINDNDIMLAEGMSHIDLINYICNKYQKNLNEDTKEDLYLTKKERFSSIFKFEIYPDVFKLLNFLKSKKIKMCVVTGSDKTFGELIVNKSFNGYFEFIITSDDIEKGKPSPVPYTVAVKRLEIQPQYVVSVENAPLGIRSSKNAGLTTFALTTTLDKKYLQEADKVFLSHISLLNYIFQLI